MRVSQAWLYVLSSITLHAGVMTFRLTPPSPQDRGRCNSFSVYLGAVQYPQLNPQPAAIDQIGGVAADCSWSWASQRTAIFADYSGSYTANRRYSNWNGATNEGRFSVLRHLSERTAWSTTFEVAKIDVSDTLSVRSGATKGALAGFGTNEGQSTDLAVLAAGQQLSTDRPGPIGLPLRYAVLDSTITHKRSERTSWYSRLEADITRYGTAQVVQTSALLAPKYGTLAVGAGVDHFMTPRTSVGVDVEAAREYASPDQFLRSDAQARINHLLSPRWSIQASMGVASRRSLRALRGTEVVDGIGSGGLTYRGDTHSVVLSVARTLGVGIASRYASEVSVDFAWIWDKPGGRSSVSTMTQWSRSQGNDAKPMNLGLYGLTIGRRLTGNLSVFAQGARGWGQGAYLTGNTGGLPVDRGPANLAGGMVRMAFVYTPRDRK